MNLSIIIAASWVSVFTDPIVNELSDLQNLSPQAKQVAYEGEKIVFLHQLWKIRDNSVCGDRQQMTPDYSSCTVKAKRLFSELCEHLSKSKDGGAYHLKYKNMYCNAAVSFNPTIISIGRGNPEQLTESEKLRIECNALTAEAIGSYDKKLIQKRDKACAEVK
jgi:hypothetical protein